VIAHVQGKKLRLKYEDEYGYDEPTTNIKTYIVNGVSILLTMFAVDEDLEFIHRWHKFDASGYRKTDSSELLKEVEEWNPKSNPDDDDCLDDGVGADGYMTPARRKRVLELLTKTGLLDRKPNINPTTLVIRLRGDRIVDALNHTLPSFIKKLTY
jgi:hypothetical protein